MFELFNEPFICESNKGGTCAAPSTINANKTLAQGGIENYYVGLSSGTYGGKTERFPYTYTITGFQQVITSIRATGATNVIICGGNHFDADLTWWTEYPVTDPLDQLAAAAHEYPDSYPQNFRKDPAGVDAMLAGIASKHPIILTEFGDEVGSNPAPFASAILSWADSHGYSVLAWTWNAWGGPNTLIRDTNTFAPTAGLGETYYNWMANHP
jgi:hypothetical protein